MTNTKNNPTKLDEEYAARGLTRPTDWLHLPDDDRLNYELVKFPWKDTEVSGYKKKDTK